MWGGYRFGRRLKIQQLIAAGIILAFAGVWTKAQGAEIGGMLKDFGVRSWGKADGLPDASVTTILQTKDGYLWIGTGAGLARFDGVKFTVVPLPPQGSNGQVSVTALCEDGSGHLWIGSQEQGLFSWADGEAKHFGRAEGLLDEGVRSLTLDGEGRLWIATRRGVNRRDGRKFDAFTTQDGLPDNQVSSVHAARSGTVWITTRGGMCRYADGRITRYHFPTDGQEQEQEFLEVYEDRRGNLWAFCATYLINLAEGKERINYFPGEKSAMTRIWSLCEGGGGRLWVGASGRGVFGFDGTKFQPVTLNEGRWPNDVRAICEDHEGNLWLGIADGGLVQLRPQSFALLKGNQGLPPGAATCLMTDASGRIYVGMESGGLYASTEDRFEKVLEGTWSLGQDIPSSLCIGADASLWIGTAGTGLYQVKDGRAAVFTTANGLSDDCVLAVCTDAEGAVWAGTQSGMLHRIANGVMATFAKADGLPGSPVTALLPALQGGLWVGTGNGVLVRSDEHFQNVATVKLAPQLSGKSILGLSEGKRHGLWVGTAGGGLGCLQGTRWSTWNMEDGLPDDVVSGVVEDDEGDVWLLMPKGLWQIANSSVVEALNGTAPPKARLLLETEIASSRTTSVGWPRALRSREGRLWFATTSGLVGIDTRGVEPEKPAPQVHLEAVLVNNEPIRLSKSSRSDSLNEPATLLKLPASLRELEFQFTALSFEEPGKVLFRHKLDGFDADWVEGGPKRKVLFGRLAGGQYQFHVTACNAEGVWNKTGETLAFIIPVPLWRTPWVLGSGGLFAACVVAGTVRIVSHRRFRRHLDQLKQHQAMDRERVRIAQDMHDEIGSKLTKISFLSERAKVELREEGQVKNKIDSIALTSRELLKSLDEIVWAVNPRNDTLEHLVGYLGQYAREYFQDTSLQCDMRLQGELPEMAMSAEMRHNLFLAFEECLNNILKHAGATHVRVEINSGKKRLQIIIRDNGRGFEPAQVAVASPLSGGGNGLPNIQRRLKDIGGECTIQSRPGEGTTVDLSIPLEAEKI
ncbi:MAG: Histidine kinase [Pedosphaera sp.]|nr:Histidine kinase [Pedosphaera sp.]